MATRTTRLASKQQQLNHDLNKVNDENRIVMPMYNSQSLKDSAVSASAADVDHHAKGLRPRAAFGDITNRVMHHDNSNKQPLSAKVASTLVSASLFDKDMNSFDNDREMVRAHTSESSKYTSEQIKHIKASAATLRQSLPLDEVDMQEQSKPRYCTLYVNDVFRNFRENETKYMAPADYMSYQTDISEKMRAMLINWMIEVHHKFKLIPQTMFLTVNYLDRFLARKVVSRKRLQLIGCTSMFVASKYEEIYAPEAGDFVYVSDNSFTKTDLFQMEGIMINTLEFHLTFPSSLVFLNRFARVADCDSKTKTLATCYLEYTMMDYSMLQHNPSKIAASCLLLALKTLSSNYGMDIERDDRLWTPLLVKHTQFVEDELVSCMEQIKTGIRKCHERSLKAIVKKYSSEEYFAVSNIVLETIG